MNNTWGNYKPAPIEIFHREALEEFHQGAEIKGNERVLDGTRYINGIEFNRLLSSFKVKVMKEYGIKSDAIPLSQGEASE